MGATVSNPFTGVYCITLTNPGLNPLNYGVELTEGALDDSGTEMVFFPYNQAESDCSASQLEVDTYADSVDGISGTTGSITSTPTPEAFFFTVP